MSTRRASPPGVERLLRYFASLPDPAQQEGNTIGTLPRDVALVPLMPNQFMYALDYERNSLFMALGFGRVFGFRTMRSTSPRSSTTSIPMMHRP